MNELTDKYIGGYFENVGCLHIKEYKDRKKENKYPLYKISIRKDNVEKIKLLEQVVKNMKPKGVEFKKYSSKQQMFYQVHKMSDLKNLLTFFNQYCILKKLHQDEVERIVNKKLSKKKGSG